MLLLTTTNKQKQILLLLYRFRFLTRFQTQQLLNHKNHRRILEWLNDLTQKEYIGKIQNNLEINTPAIYYMKINSIRYLKEIPSLEKSNLNKFYKEHKKSDKFINLCLLIADIFISLKEKYKNNPSFSFFTQSDFTKDGLIREIFPHFSYKRKRKEPYFIGEVFNADMPRFAIRHRIESYLDFFLDHNWQKYDELPKLLFICPNNKTEEYIAKFTKRIQLEKDENMEIFVTTEEKIKNMGIENEIWREVMSD